MIKVSAGPEDFALDPDGPRGPRLLVAATERRRGKKKEAGKFWSVDLTGPEKDRAIEVKNSKDVWPTGIAVRRFGEEHRLYATNNPPGQAASIELFVLEGDALRWKQSFASPNLKFPNDVIALADGSLCVTDIDSGIVFAVDTAKNVWTPFIKTAKPNGLATDRAERYLFVNAFTAKELRIFERASGTLKKTVPLPGLPDNLQWEIEDRVLDVALHTSLAKIGLHLKLSSSIRSPSRGCRLDVSSFLADGTSDVRVERLYDLPDFSGGSAALVYNGTLYVSQVMKDQIYVGTPPT
jgi:hypothetical protein